jgi:hypothetical protein
MKDYFDSGSNMMRMKICTINTFGKEIVSYGRRSELKKILRGGGNVWKSKR